MTKYQRTYVRAEERTYRCDELSALRVEVGELGVGAQEQGLGRRPDLHEVLVEHVELVLTRHLVLQVEKQQAKHNTSSFIMDSYSMDGDEFDLFSYEMKTIERTRHAERMEGIRRFEMNWVCFG